MGRRRRQRAGLLAIALLLASAVCFADNEPRILVYRSPEHPLAGSQWTLTLLVAHHEPDEVSIYAPHFTGALMLDQVVKSPRFFNPVTGQSQADGAFEAAFERWTAMEYRFMLSSPGIINFEAFTVVTPQGQAETAPFDLVVEREQNASALQSYQLAWEGLPPGIAVGDSAIISLRMSGGNYANALPEAEAFLPPVPPGHIIESLPLSLEEKSARIALKLRLIPLEAGPFALDRRQLAHGSAVFEIPALRIPVSRAALEPVQENAAPPQSRAGAAPFPPLEKAAQDYPALYQKRREECSAIYAAARNLWENGSRAGALAALRKNERDHPAGAIFAAIRRGAEASLGIAGARDEKKRLLPFLKEKTRHAVLRETAVRQIPDIAGEEVARFREGQPVQIMSQHNAWVRVITNDYNGNSGWIPEGNIVFY